MTTLFFRTLTGTVVVAGLAACGLGACGHRGPRMPRFSSPIHLDGDPAAPAQAQADPQAPARPSPIPAASADVIITQLTATPDTDESYPALAPDGSFVLFMSLEAANRKLSKFSLSAVDAHRSTAPSQYTGDGVRALDPTFAPDGKSYFFVSDSMGKWAVVHSSSSSPAAAVTLVSGANALEPRHPSVSPDGVRVAFQMRKVGAHVIATSQIDGSRLAVLGPGTAPTFSPDGSRLTFVRLAGQRSQVFTMDAASGKSVTQITTGDFDAMSPAYSPDGAYVAFTSNRGAQAKAKNVFVVRTDGTQLRQLTNGTHEVRDLSWGRDGAIYFSADPDGTGQLDIFRLASKDFAAASAPAPAAPPPPAPPPFVAPQPAYAPQPQPPPPAYVPPAPQPAYVPPAPAPVSGPACGTPDDCPNLACACNNRRVINTRQCDNRVCAPVQTACDASCRRHSGWTGHLAGGAPAPVAQPQTPAPAPPPPPPKLAVGKTCSVDNECESAVCVFKGGASRGYCSKECQNFPDCPTFWECKAVRNGSAKYCVQR